MEIDKSLMKDDLGRFRTQGLFLEPLYGPEAIYTRKDQDHVNNGKTYYSIKRLYLEMEDPTEWEFANTYFYNWNHWQRVCNNKEYAPLVEECRNELELKLRSKGVKDMIKSASLGNYQASKWLIDRGWQTRGAGRPTKAETESERKKASDILETYSADVVRLREVK